MLNTVRMALSRAIGTHLSVQLPCEASVRTSSVTSVFSKAILTPQRFPVEIRQLSTSCVAYAQNHEDFIGPRNWPRHNTKMYPPQEPGEERRKAYVCHMNLNFKYSPDKMWYIACLVRGMSIDEAIRQLDYVKKKGAWIAKKTLLEAQDLAVREHGVEFKSNLWVSESFTTKGLVVKGYRRHAKKRVGIIKYRYCHYFCTLEEGQPPTNYFQTPVRDAPTMLEEWISKRRQLRIPASI